MTKTGFGSGAEGAQNTRVACMPEAIATDVYYRLFYGALRSYGVILVPDARYDLRWFKENRAQVDWVHLHWVQPYYMSWNFPRIVVGTARFLWFLVRLRQMGYRLAWTCHNLFPHESRSRLADYLVRLTLARLSHLVVVHSRYVQTEVARWFRRRRNVVVVPHGHFIDCYPNQISREAARRRLGLVKESFVYLFFGVVRPYKGVEGLIDRFRELDSKNSVLVIAGKPMSEPYKALLIRRAEGDPRIQFRLEYVSDEEIQVYFNAADITVLPFQKISTSGSLLLALSFGSPVVIPDVPSLREYVNSEVAYVMKDDEGLVAALRDARARVQDGTLKLGPPTIEWARQFDWRQAASVLGPMFEDRGERHMRSQ
jgi:beta-1,4-mannosyltransferase